MYFVLDAQENETTEKTGSVVDVDDNAFVSTSQDNEVKQVNNTKKVNNKAIEKSNIDSSTHKSDNVNVATHVIDMDALFGQVNNQATRSKDITNEKEIVNSEKEHTWIKSSSVDGNKKTNNTALARDGQPSPLTSFSLIRELQSRRKPLQHIGELDAFLQEWNRYLPITLHVSIANHHDDACNHEQHHLLKTTAQTIYFDSAINHVLNDAHTIQKEKCAQLPVPLILHLIGPLRVCRTADILSVVEDVLLEDCDVNFLRLTAVQCSDLSFTSLEGVNLTNIGGIEYSSMLKTHANNNTTDNEYKYTAQIANSKSNGVAAAGGNADNTKTVNNTLSTHVNHSSKEGVMIDKPTTLPSSTVVGEAEQMKMLRDAHYRVRIFVKNVLDSTFDECTSFTMTRCTCDPSELGDAIPLNLCALEELRFVHCPLSSAHVSSLLQLAVHQTMTSSTSHAYRLSRQLNYENEHCNLHNGNLASNKNNNNDNVSEGYTIAFGKLVNLQLSGAITTEAVMDLLNYFDEELSQCSSLRLLQIPSVLVRAARAHHFIQSHPLVQVKAN